MEDHQKWNEKVKSIAGGITILKPTKGVWISLEGKLFKDDMVPVRVYCTEKQMNKIMDLTILHYSQEAVMAYEISANVKIKHKH